ncbi:MAG TPA: hypothetical protein G4O07_08005 [Dehalococcoidia bacterium]|nr:hypothetical protein [Dehalococcoidia bacterium]
MASRLSGSAAGLVSLSAPFRHFIKQSIRRPTHQVEIQLEEHLNSIGVPVELIRERNISQHRREAKGMTVTTNLLARAHVCLKRITSIEVYRVSTRSREKSTVLDEITYITDLEPGVTLTRIPVLTNAVLTEREDSPAAFYWSGFEWGKLPLLAHCLEVDKDLNRRLLHHFSTDTPGDLRITALPDNKVGITTSYDPQYLPSRGFLSCLEQIADHINRYAVEQNRTRDAFTSRWQPG